MLEVGSRYQADESASCERFPARTKIHTRAAWERELWKCTVGKRKKEEGRADAPNWPRRGEPLLERLHICYFQTYAK